MQDGFYWVQIKGEKQMVVEVIRDAMYLAGLEEHFYFEGGQWKSTVYSGKVDISFLSGPLEVPTEKQRSTT